MIININGKTFNIDENGASGSYRAEYAADTLEYYSFSIKEPHSEYALRDLLTDMMHFCKSRGIDFDDELRIARDNFDEEQ